MGDEAGTIILKPGELVSTRFGRGHIVQYRPEDGIYKVKLIGPEEQPSSSTEDETTHIEDSNSVKQTSSVFMYCVPMQVSREIAMELDVAYQALDTMRKLNLEMDCQEKNIPYTALDLEQHCTVCLFARPPIVPPSVSSSSYFRQSRPKRYATKKSPACLCCAMPVCNPHASATFRQEKIHICLTCESLFGTDFVVQVLTFADRRQRRLQMDRCMDVYDRAVLLLKYAASSNSMDEIARRMQSAAVRQNRVGLGSSSAGIVSGVLGIVSCATLLTPVGPPLMIASLLFGGSSYAAQTGAEVRHAYFFAPNHQADRLIALHGICWNILRIIALVRDTVQLDCTLMNADLYSENQDASNHPIAIDKNDSKICNADNHCQSQSSAPPQEHGVLARAKSDVPHHTTSPSKSWNHSATDVLHRASSMGSIRSTDNKRDKNGSSTSGSISPKMVVAVGESGGPVVVAANGKRGGNGAANRGARFLSRSTTAALNSMQFARVGGGALSAATLVWETHNLRNTIKRMQAGNPCKKAETVRKIKDQIRELPLTSIIAAECDKVLAKVDDRKSVLTEEEVLSLLDENAEVWKQAQDDASASSISQSEETGESLLTDNSGSSPQRLSFRNRIFRSSVKVRTTTHDTSMSSVGYNDDDDPLSTSLNASLKPPSCEQLDDMVETSHQDKGTLDKTNESSLNQ